MADFVVLDVFLCAILIVVLAVLIKFVSSLVAWVYHKLQQMRENRKGVRKHVRKKSS